MEAKLPIILIAWFIANFVPHIVVFVLARKVYYQLSPRSAIATETSIMLFNLILPIALLLHSSPGCEVMQRLGWRWSGWRVAWAGSGGFIMSMFVLYIIRELIREPILSPGQELRPRELAMTITMLLTVTALGEETMFREYIQTGLSWGFWWLPCSSACAICLWTCTTASCRKLLPRPGPPGCSSYTSLPSYLE